MNAAAQPAPEEQPKVEVTPQEMAAQARVHAENQWNLVADKERRRLAIERGLMDKNGNITQRGNLLVSPENLKGSQVTVEALRELVKLPGDTMRYAKDKNGNPRMATNKYGLAAWPKAKGRLKPHMAHNAHTIKNAAIAIFRNLFTLHREEAEIRAKNDGVEIHGIPQEEIAKIGARAATLAARQVKDDLRARKNRARRRQELSRRINYGLQPRNTNVRAYIGG